jgi:hypothetical protein
LLFFFKHRIIIYHCSFAVSGEEYIVGAAADGGLSDRRKVKTKAGAIAPAGGIESACYFAAVFVAVVPPNAASFFIKRLFNRAALFLWITPLPAA